MYVLFSNFLLVIAGLNYLLPWGGNSEAMGAPCSTACSREWLGNWVHLNLGTTGLFWCSPSPPGVGVGGAGSPGEGIQRAVSRERFCSLYLRTD